MLKSKDIPGVPRLGRKHPLPVPRKPTVTFQPQTYQDIQKGVNRLANAIRPTLGPLARNVLMERLERQDLPEFLDDGATIARRIIEIQPRGQDVGAMLLRHALWNMHMDVGDGTSTMAVIYQVILNEGIRSIIEYGCNAILLRRGLEKGLSVVLKGLQSQVIPLEGQEQIAAVARGMCQGDFELADLLGEIYDIVGPEGLIVVEGWNRIGIEREYLEGTYWLLSGWFSRHLVTDPTEKRTMYEDAHLLISDMSFKDPTALVPVLEKCVRGGVKKLVIVAKEVSDMVIGLLVNNNKAKTIQTLAVRTPRVAEMDRVAAMEDISALAGGRMFYSASNPNLDDFQVSDLGFARRAWATDSLFGLFGGQGDPRLIRQQINKIRSLLKMDHEPFEKRMLQQRLGRLAGGTAILRLGGISDSARETRKEVAERAVASLRHAVQGGVVSGGGIALLHARAALQELDAENPDEALAYKILSRALEEPLRTIVQNAGFSPDVILYRLNQSGPEAGFDVFSADIVNMPERGILDSILILENGLKTAVSGAAMALTTDVIIHHRKPKEELEP